MAWKPTPTKLPKHQVSEEASTINSEQDWVGTRLGHWAAEDNKDLNNNVRRPIERSTTMVV